MDTALAQDRFGHRTYTVRRKFFRIFGEAFHIYDSVGNVAFYSKMKAFRLKEDLRLYTGEDMRTEVLSMKARSILDFGVTFDVMDSQRGVKIGAIRRKALKSILQDTWTIMDADDREVGEVQEDSMLLAMVRRFLVNLVPQSWNATVGGQPVALYKQHFNPFILKVSIDFSADPQGRLDRRMGIAIAVLLNAIEGRQASYG